MPKEKFYAHLKVPAAIRQSFIDDIDQIVWRNKLSPTTLNVAPGNMVKEIALLEVKLRKQSYNKELFRFLTRNVALYFVFLLTYESKAQLLIHYKEPVANRPDRFNILETYATVWMDEAAIKLTISGLSMDMVYQNFVRQIGEIEDTDECIEFRERIEKQKAIGKTKRLISILELNLRKEPQFNKQLEISNKIKKLKQSIYG
jgi:hypothetical protein